MLINRLQSNLQKSFVNSYLIYTPKINTIALELRLQFEKKATYAVG